MVAAFLCRRASEHSGASLDQYNVRAGYTESTYFDAEPGPVTMTKPRGRSGGRIRGGWDALRALEGLKAPPERTRWAVFV